MTVVTADRVVTGSVVHAPGWISHQDGLITDVGAGRPEQPDHDHGDATLVPGFVDVHVHGGGGGSFTTRDPASALRAIDTHRRHGTTTTMASLVTASPVDLLASVSMLADLYRDGIVAGVHLEGPWISPHRYGAHDSRELRDPSAAEISRLLTAGGGAIAMVTVAPELPGGLDAVRQLADAGVVAAVGHTDCSYSAADDAIGAGARVATHLFNAMRPIHHRDPGPIIALLADPRVTVELIADGVHLDPALHRYVVRTAGSERVALVTDAMAATGLGDGRYRLGPMAVEVVDGVARIPGTPTIAGGTATMDQLFRAAVGIWGTCGSDGASDDAEVPAWPTDEALVHATRQTSANPARVLGRTDIGSLAPGRRADFVALDADLRVTEVVVGGTPWPAPSCSARS
jgi:N-acetylglucosamine-6-phosphate deacetylase